MANTITLFPMIGNMIEFKKFLQLMAITCLSTLPARFLL